MAEVTRLEVLQHARALAEQIGAVTNGYHYFEDADGCELAPTEVTSVDGVCGVCIAGACALAEVSLGIAPSARSSYDWQAAAGRAAGSIAGITTAITRGGTPHVLGVLDEMIEEESA